MNTVRLDLAWAIQGREDQWPVLAQQYFLNGGTFSKWRPCV